MQRVYDHVTLDKVLHFFLSSNQTTHMVRTGRLHSLAGSSMCLLAIPIHCASGIRLAGWTPECPAGWMDP